MNFIDKLTAAQQRNKSYLCIGLDIVIADLPLPMLSVDDPMLPFGRAIIGATQDLVCAYKLDLAYYFAEGAAGMVALERIVRIIPSDIPIILDLGCSALAAGAAAYARGAYTQFQADAVVLWPQGRESIVDEFLRDPDKTVFADFPEEEPAYTYHWMNQWQREYVAGRVGMVAHPHKPSGMRVLRNRCPNVPFMMRLSQVEHHAAILADGKTKEGLGPLVCASSEVIYASKTLEFADDMRNAALALRDALVISS